MNDEQSKVDLVALLDSLTQLDAISLGNITAEAFFHRQPEFTGDQNKIEPGVALKLVQMGADAEQFRHVMKAINKFLYEHHLFIGESTMWHVLVRPRIKLPDGSYRDGPNKLPDGEYRHNFVTASEAVTDALTIAFERAASSYRDLPPALVAEIRNRDLPPETIERILDNKLIATLIRKHETRQSDRSEDPNLYPGLGVVLTFKTADETPPAE